MDEGQGCVVGRGWQAGVGWCAGVIYVGLDKWGQSMITDKAIV